MGVKLIWTLPDSESSFDTVYIYRANSKDGTYNEIHNQSISDYTYYDMTGTSSNWYKIRFYDSSSSTWSDFSDPMNGADYGSYCTVQDVKDIMDVSSSVSDLDIFKISRIASMQINEDLLSKVYREKVEYIDNVKTNNIDGTNTTFYVKNYPIGDYNNDFIVDETDITVIKRRVVSGQYTETELTVSSIDAESGQFVLTSAPESDSVLYVTYAYCPIHYPVDPPHELIRQATAYLTSYLLKNKINDGSLVTKYTLDRLSITRMADTVKHDWIQYQNLISKILRPEVG